MRLHQLQLSAFLAYGGTETVDFDALSEAGFFLIHGQTGAGKTALLDAIAFAIYGELPGARKGVKSIRSDHAAVETPTFVLLDATVGSQRLRIRRNPEYLRPARRGGGTTTEKAAVSIERWTGSDWEPLTASAQEAGVHIRGWIGLGADQFFRLALIPQGAFANFLNASSKARAEILEELFKDDLVVFGRVERFFRDALDVAEKELRLADQGIGVERARVAEVLSEAGVAADAVLDAAWIRERIDAEQTAVEETRSQRDSAKARHDIDAAEQSRAEAAITASEKYQQAKAAVGRAADALDAYRLRIAGFTTQDADTFDASLEQAEAAARERVAEALRRNASSAGLADARRALRDDLETLADNHRMLDALQASIAADLPRRQQFQVDANAGVNAAQGLADATLEVSACQQRVDAATVRDAAATTLATCRAELTAADLRLAEAEAHLHDTERARNRSHAVVLAALLQPGEPCPVCGSTQHPAPESGEESQAADDAVQAAQLLLAQARDAQAKAAGAFHRADATWSQVVAQLGASGDVALGDLVAARDAARSLQVGIAAVVEAAQGAAAALAELEEAHALRKVQAEELQAQRARLELTKAEHAAEVATLEQSLGIGPDEELVSADAGPLQSEVDRIVALRAEGRVLAEAAQRAQGALEALGEVTTGELPNLAELQARRAESELALRDVEAALTNRTRVVARLLERMEAFERAAVHQETAAAKRVELAAIARPVNGEGPSRTKLTQYFLAARLRQVLERANSRLRRMTDDRFEFVFDAEAKGAGYKSLEIAVLDAWNGAQRAVSSLSGGETFTASLALALGLADIVQSEAGGTALDSLFIDEGFGTLSPDFLNRVIQDLDRLRAGGRLVGIISHVDDLKARIPMQLEVRKSSTGSTVAPVIGELD
jgi:exonuclease SbcC